MYVMLVNRTVLMASRVLCASRASVGFNIWHHQLWSLSSWPMVSVTPRANGHQLSSIVTVCYFELTVCTFRSGGGPAFCSHSNTSDEVAETRGNPCKVSHTSPEDHRATDLELAFPSRFLSISSIKAGLFTLVQVKFVSGDVTHPDTLHSACVGKDALVCAVGARQGWRLPLFGLDQQTPRKVDFEVNGISSAA